MALMYCFANNDRIAKKLDAIEVLRVAPR